MTVCLICPHYEELFEDEDDWFEHVCGCNGGEQCPDCLEQGCLGDCVEDDDL